MKQIENLIYNKIIYNVTQMVLKNKGFWNPENCKFSMETLIKTRKIGGSLAVTIPHEIVEHENLTENEIVKISIEKVKKSGFGMFKNLGSFTKEDKFKGQLEDE